MIMNMVFKMSVIAEGVKGQLNKEKVEKYLENLIEENIGGKAYINELRINYMKEMNQDEDRRCLQGQ